MFTVMCKTAAGEPCYMERKSNLWLSAIKPGVLLFTTRGGAKTALTAWLSRHQDEKAKRYWLVWWDGRQVSVVGLMRGERQWEE